MRQVEIDLPVIGLAKQFEEIFRPGKSAPLILPRHSKALHVLQRVRDEAHRFAVSYHRKLRSKGTTRSALDSVPGIGPKRKKELLKHFGSVERIRSASVDDLAACPGMNRKAAEAVFNSLTGA